MSEIVPIPKDITQLDSFFHDLTTNFLTNQLASNLFDGSQILQQLCPAANKILAEQNKLVKKFKEQAATLKTPDSVQKVFDEELDRFLGLELPRYPENHSTHTHKIL
ncbi:hypothetical protein JVU11DRAFT_9100 [Chiua virens]|nr:hypothetical protein JVU11DRAFT_9100 [Chiua virens]